MMRVGLEYFGRKTSSGGQSAISMRAVFEYNLVRRSLYFFILPKYRASISHQFSEDIRAAIGITAVAPLY